MIDATTMVSRELVFLSAEDRNRMTRLYEEVVTRLEEMALITDRTLNTKPGLCREVKFSPLVAPEQTDLAPVEIVATAGGRGYYDYAEGACFLA